MICEVEEREKCVIINNKFEKDNLKSVFVYIIRYKALYLSICVHTQPLCSLKIQLLKRKMKKKKRSMKQQ